MKVKIGDQTIEVPEGVEVRIIDKEEKPKWEPKYKADDYVRFEGEVYSVVRVEYWDYVVYNPETREYSRIIFDLEKEMELLPDYEEIICAWGDAHDPELRKKINDAWNKNREQFAPILRTLYARDIEEITDHDAFQYEEWKDSPEYRRGVCVGDWEDYNKMALNHMQREWDFFADNYLSHIADDTDLECILAFLRYPYLPIYGFDDYKV